VIHQGKFAEGVEALAESFERAGRVDLSALCDRAAYWLRGGNGLDLISLSEVVESCRATLHDALGQGSTEEFIARTTMEITANLRSIESDVVTASTKSEDLIDQAARLQAVAILTSEIFRRPR